MRVLGVDPGTIHMGFGVVDEHGSDLRLHSCGTLEASQKRPIEERLWQMYEQLGALIDSSHPDVVAVEEPFVVQAPRRSALAVGEARAVAMLAATGRHLPLYHYTPSKVRSTIANYGSSDKEQVRLMVSLLLGQEITGVRLDASDALAVAICHLRHATLETMAPAEPVARRVRR